LSVDKTPTHTFQRGDAVTHPRRPEWGQGVVRQATTIQYQGQSAQRLAIDFAHQGRVVINTAVAPIAPKGNPPPMRSANTTSSGSGWLDQLEKANTGSKHELWDLPSAMTDPFASLTQRITATLESFRYSAEPRSLIDWAIAQTDLHDPLSKYTRHELELAFPRFTRDRNSHLLDLVRQAKRRGERQLLDQMRSGTRLPAARIALDKAIKS